MGRYGWRPLTVTAAQAAAGSRLIGGPVRLRGWSLDSGPAGQAKDMRGTAAAPGALGNIASVALPSGSYQISWTVELTGTPGAADVDNVELVVGATIIAQSVNLGAVGNYLQELQTFSVANGPLTLAANAIGAATAGSVYTVNAEITPTGYAKATIFDGAQPLAYPNVPNGGGITQDVGGDGVQVRNQLSILNTQGAVSGVLFYEMVLPHTDPDYADDYASK